MYDCVEGDSVVVDTPGCEKRPAKFAPVVRTQ